MPFMFQVNLQADLFAFIAAVCTLEIDLAWLLYGSKMAQMLSGICFSWKKTLSVFKRIFFQALISGSHHSRWTTNFK